MKGFCLEEFLMVQLEMKRGDFEMYIRILFWTRSSFTQLLWEMEESQA